MNDWVHDAVGYLLTVLGTCVVALIGWLSWLTVELINRGEKVAKLEARIDDMPEKLREIRSVLEVMRTEAHDRAEGVYKHVEAVRRELMDEIKDGDRRSGEDRRQNEERHR
jgi:hypothetical protein